MLSGVKRSISRHPLQTLSLLFPSLGLKYCISVGEYGGKRVTAAEICPDDLGCIEVDKDKTILGFWDSGNMSVCSSFQIPSDCEAHCSSRCGYRRVFHGF